MTEPKPVEPDDETDKSDSKNLSSNTEQDEQNAAAKPVQRGRTFGAAGREKRG